MSMSDLRFAYLSNHISGAVKLDFLAARGVLPAALITLSPVDAAKHGVAGYHDFSADAARYAIPLHVASSFTLDDPVDHQFLVECGCDLLLVSGWQRLIPAAVLAQFPLGVVAEHGSAEYLPRGRGRSPVCWSLLAGRPRFIVHLFMADEAADAGAVIDCAAVDVNEFDDVYTVYAKIGMVSGMLFLRHRQALAAGGCRAMPLAPVPPSYYRKRGPADDWIDWAGSSTRQIHDHVRATTRPYPGAKTRAGGDVVVVWRAQPFAHSLLDDSTAVPGQVLARLPDGSLVTKTTDGSLLLRDYSCPRPIVRGECLG